MLVQSSYIQRCASISYTLIKYIMIALPMCVLVYNSNALAFSSLPDFFSCNFILLGLGLNNRPQPTSADNKPTLIGQSEDISILREMIKRVAPSLAPVFIAGASGTGKELVARMIRDQGPRRDKPFVAVNCGAIPNELMESEFFGHVKGAFTSAHSDKPGLFRAASGGTLFLDEIAELPIAMQVKLLRAIQEKAVKPIGSDKEVKVDVRLLSASHQPLSELVTEGLFREDLFYRIHVIDIYVPTLAQHPEDIPALAQHILTKLTPMVPHLTPKLTDAALAALREYSFPGNVRELENILERALTLSEDGIIKDTDLELQTIKPLQQAPYVTHTTSPLTEHLFAREYEIVLDALHRHQWNRTQTAKALGISPRALRYRMKKLGL